jgi:hypothetical protein
MATPQIIEQFARLNEEFARVHDSEIQRLINNQRSLEIQNIKDTNSFCPFSQMQNRTVSPEDVQRTLEEGYGDANILKSLMCLNNSIVAFPASGGGSSFKVRHYLENLRQIGCESVEGCALLTDIRPHGKNLFITKVPRRNEPRARFDQIHEYFIGAFGTNSLRSKIPNFSFIMGIFQCSPPYLDNKTLTFCQNNVAGNQINYIMYENVTNSITLQDFIIGGCTFEEYLNVLVQLVLAIDLAYREFDFTHFDFHTQNVLIRELPQQILIPYESGYLRTKYIATIIDYGRSHIKYNGNNFGYDLIEGGIYPNKSYPMFDIYKLLMFSLADAAFGTYNMKSYVGLSDNQIAQRGMLINPSVFQNVKELISYFNPSLPRNNITNQLTTVADYLIKTRRFYYLLPYSPQFDIRPLLFFQYAILPTYSGVIGTFLQSRPLANFSIYGCNSKGTCYGLEQAIMEYTQPDIKYINDVYIFYEMLITSKVPLQELMYRGENQYENYINQLRIDRNKMVNEYNRVIQGFNIVSLIRGAAGNLKFQKIFLDLYRNYIDRSVKILDLLTSITQIETIIRTLNQLYPIKSQQIVPGLNYRYSDIIRLEFDPIRQSIYKINEVVASIKQDIRYVQTLNEREVLRAYPNALWLFQKMPTLNLAIAQI